MNSGRFMILQLHGRESGLDGKVAQAHCRWGQSRTREIDRGSAWDSGSISVPSDACGNL
jgi:hypothetical protein